jgi:hypothetical protein
MQMKKKEGFFVSLSRVGYFSAPASVVGVLFWDYNVYFNHLLVYALEHPGLGLVLANTLNLNAYAFPV